MRNKYKFQVIQDFAMLFILLSLMGYHLWGEYTHEVLGVAFISIILLHIGLNFYWVKELRQGEYTAFRVLQTLLNLLLFLVFSSSMVSGLMLSQHLVPNLPIHHSSDLVRKIHMTSVHWGQMLVALHLGLHWKMLSNFFFKLWSISPESTLATRVIPGFFWFVSAYGVYAFFQRSLFSYLSMRVDFAFFNFHESISMFYIDYLSISILVAYLTHYLLTLFLFAHKSQK